LNCPVMSVVWFLLACLNLSLRPTTYETFCRTHLGNMYTPQFRERISSIVYFVTHYIESLFWLRFLYGKVYLYYRMPKILEWTNGITLFYLCVTHVRFSTHILTKVFTFTENIKGLNKLLIIAYRPHINIFHS
jgi:hypothetical protein